MHKMSPTLLIVILIIFTAAVYALLTPTNFKQIRSSSKAVSSIKAYAALQFGVPENKVTIITSSKQDWQDICLDIKIPDYKCTKAKISGYEATIEAGGYKTIYRASDDGTIIRVVK